ncbi:MAG: 3-keto-disaccharide hydrolase [Akkermansiaceae bacterium]
MKLIATFVLVMAPAVLAAGEWVSLFDGKSMNGWVNQGKANWHVEGGALTASKGPVGLLTTAKTYENYELKLEFKAAIGTNSGVFLNTEALIEDEAVDCYEVNIAPPSNGFPTGSIVKHRLIKDQGEKNDWRTYHLKVNQGEVTVILDGKTLMKYKPKNPRGAGFIGLQKNAGKIQFRNLKIREL